MVAKVPIPKLVHHEKEHTMANFTNFMLGNYLGRDPSCLTKPANWLHLTCYQDLLIAKPVQNAH